MSWGCGTYVEDIKLINLVTTNLVKRKKNHGTQGYCHEHIFFGSCQTWIKQIIEINKMQLTEIYFLYFKKDVIIIYKNRKIILNSKISLDFGGSKN